LTVVAVTSDRAEGAEVSVTHAKAPGCPELREESVTTKRATIVSRTGQGMGTSSSDGPI
jgi:hypothetical protein